MVSHVDNIFPVIKTSPWLLLSSLPSNKPHRISAEPTPFFTGTFWNLPPEPTPAYTGTFRNLLEPASRNLHQHTPELSGTFRNLPRPSGTNLSEPSGTCFRNLHQHTPEPSGTPEVSGTFRSPPPEPTPAHTGTLRTFRNSPPQKHQHTRDSPEPSGTFLRDLLLRPAPAHTGAYLGWRPISSRCWGK